MAKKVGIFLHLIILVAFLFLIFFPLDSYFKAGIDLSSMLAPPSANHLLGTDNLGRDLLIRFSEAVKGAVIPLWITVLGCTVAGIFFGLISIVVGETNKSFKSLSTLVKIGMSIVAAIPIGVVAFTFSVIQEKAGIGPVLLSLGFLFLIRGYLQISDLYLEDKKLAYWQAHKSIGGALWARLVNYGIRGRWGDILFVSFCFHLQVSVAIEASLSYLGFGIQEPQASFGNMLASHFDLYLKGQWQVLIFIVGALLLCTQAPISVASLASLKKKLNS